MFKPMTGLLFFLFLFVPGRAFVLASEGDLVVVAPYKTDEGVEIGSLLLKNDGSKETLLELPGFFLVNSHEKFERKEARTRRPPPHQWWIFQESTSQVYKWVVFFKDELVKEKALVQSPESNYRAMEYQTKGAQAYFLCTESYDGGEFGSSEAVLVKTRFFLKEKTVTRETGFGFPKKMSERQKINAALYSFDSGQKVQSLALLGALKRNPERDYFLGYLLVKDNRFGEAKKILLPLLEKEDSLYARLANSLLMANDPESKKGR